VPDATEKQSKIRFDGTINAGHVLTFVSMMGVGFAVYSTFDKRVLVLEENRRYQVQVDHAQDLQARTASDQVNTGLLRLERQVEKLNDKLDDDKSRRTAP